MELYSPSDVHVGHEGIRTCDDINGPFRGFIEGGGSEAYLVVACTPCC